jgi:hypothetical protein
MVRKKRQTGGQPGNQNARKHGFYSPHLTPGELSEYWRLVESLRMDPQLALARTKLTTALGIAPDNRRVLQEGTGLVAKMCVQNNAIDAADAGLLKDATRAILRASATGDAALTKRVASEILQVLESSQNE